MLNCGVYLRLLRRLLLVLMACWPLQGYAQGAVLEVITLKYRTAEQVMPVLKPLLHKDGTLSGLQNQLIVRTSPANLAELKRILVTLDAMPRRLRITVREDAALDRDRTQAEISGRVAAAGGAPGSGDADAALEARRGGENARARIDNTRSLQNDNNTQTLQVLEGSSAFIRMGQSVAVPQRQVVRTVINGQIVERVSNAAEYRDVVTGFSVLPRLAGDRVTLEISSQRDAAPGPEQNLPGGSMNVQRAATTVSGKLGEWMDLGGVAQGATNQQSVILGSTRENSADNRRILVKVEEIR